ncbi:hypothetical protein SKAU_G00110710 [Synaphobranchus kaupii]|uniref:Uncharacterized protein n=1 Tax=Synaphobranchus kaupii TaxID=118154 RepID=A0A9Q1J8F4_SYNKA|nr:hypothetical protein SKAU_G00110710 [Synaphobranchus kaupii]
MQSTQTALGICLGSLLLHFLDRLAKGLQSVKSSPGPMAGLGLTFSQQQLTQASGAAAGPRWTEESVATCESS